ncbi:GlmU family protein [Namhaeicola litoreus]|uniref:GlmU family protein n=1 Tax=Namhaeicola litoreus TaxID=1052145 RepID=A0ABW3Y6A8_9FLAO
MNYILFDGPSRPGLLPLTYTKPVADLRIGILTIREKWEKLLGSTTTTITEDYLSEKFPLVELEQNVLINAAVLPNSKLIETIFELSENQMILYKDEIIAFFSKEDQEINFEEFEKIHFEENLVILKNTWDLFEFNEVALKSDFELLTEGRKSAPIPKNVQCINKELIFLEEGVSIDFAILNASKGPIYLGKHSEIMEGTAIRGPFAILEHGVVKMGSKVYGATTVGPKSKIGGEVHNVILSGNSSKGHDGYLGNSVIGEWCNIGADTNNSNLKNDYSTVKSWNYEENRFVNTGLQFCGLIMGDHSKCGINTMFNTGTVVGVSANIFGSDFPRNFIPSFSWGGSKGYTTYTIEKAFATVERVMNRKNEVFTKHDQNILKHVFELTSGYRNFK